MMDMAQMCGNRSLPNTQPQKGIDSLHFSPDPWVVRQQARGAKSGLGSRVFPCSPGGMGDRMKSSFSRQANPKDKGKETEEELCPPNFSSRIQH